MLSGRRDHGVGAEERSKRNLKSGVGRGGQSRLGRAGEEVCCRQARTDPGRDKKRQPRGLFINV